MQSLIQDLRYASRLLKRNPGFSTVVVITLALGIGANTAIFSTVDALLLHPHSFPDMERLVLVREGRASQADDDKAFSPADFADVAVQIHSFNELAAFRFTDFNLSVQDRDLAADGVAVSANFFGLLGAPASIGRTFNSAEDQPGHEQEVLISHRYWVANFGADRGVIGQTLRINGHKYSVIGVMPKDFNFPLGIDMWIPLALHQQEWSDRKAQTLHVVGKLRPEVSLAQAMAETKILADRLAAQFPQTNSGREITLLRLRSEQYQYTIPMFLTLQAAAGFVLILVCANLTNLFFAHLIGRQHEIAIRTALGADWISVAKTFLSENLLLSAVAGVIAIGVSFWGVKLIRVGIPAEMSKWIAGWERIRLNGSVLGFALLLTIVLALLFGLLLTIRAARTDPHKALKEGNAGSSTGAGRERLRAMLVVTQIVLAMVLLVGAGLMAKGFVHLAIVYQGFQPEGVETMQISLPQTTYGGNDLRITSFYEQFLRSAQALPGVKSVGIADNIPASNVDNSTTPFTVEGRPSLREGEIPTADLESISPNFLSSLEVPLLEGRNLSDQDTQDAPRVALINRSMAQEFWPNQMPIGRRFKLGDARANAPWIAIVGVVGDVKQNWWDSRPRPVIYTPYQQLPQQAMNAVIRTSSNPMTVIAGAREIVRKLNPEIALMDVQDMKGVIANSLSPVRIIGLIMSIFGLLALALSALGVYGVLAQGVAQRTREFGIRMALGASQKDLIKEVIVQASRLAMIGLVIAVPISLGLTHIMTSLFFGLIGLSLQILAAFAVVLLTSAAAAAYIPARRAARVDPTVALRYE